MAKRKQAKSFPKWLVFFGVIVLLTALLWKPYWNYYFKNNSASPIPTPSQYGTVVKSDLANVYYNYKYGFSFVYPLGMNQYPDDQLLGIPRLDHILIGFPNSDRAIRLEVYPNPYRLPAILWWEDKFYKLLTLAENDRVHFKPNEYTLSYETIGPHTWLLEKKSAQTFYILQNGNTIILAEPGNLNETHTILASVNLIPIISNSDPCANNIGVSIKLHPEWKCSTKPNAITLQSNKLTIQVSDLGREELIGYRSDFTTFYTDKNLTFSMFADPLKRKEIMGHFIKTLNLGGGSIWISITRPDSSVLDLSQAEKEELISQIKDINLN